MHSSEPTPIHPTDAVEFYDQLWSTDWQDMERLNPTARHLEAQIVKYIEKVAPVKSVLDVGCGIGVNVKRIHEYFPETVLVGTDLSAGILKLAENYVGKNDKISYQVMNLEKDAPGAKHDLVLCSQVLEHIEDDRKALQHLSQITERYLLITVPGGKFNSTSRLVGHFRHYSKKEIDDKILAAGFEILLSREWGFPFHSLYKWCLGHLSEESQKKVGLGKYGFFKKLTASILYYLFFGNIFNYGANVIVLAKKRATSPSPSNNGGQHGIV